MQQRSEELLKPLFRFNTENPILNILLTDKEICYREKKGISVTIKR